MAPVNKKADVMLRVKQRAIISLVVLLVAWLEKLIGLSMLVSVHSLCYSSFSIFITYNVLFLFASS